MSPRKVRLVVNAIRGQKATVAETRLQFMQQRAAQPVLKLLRSAMANAVNNFQLSKESLTIAKITADGGPSLKRFSPRAFGRAAPIRQRTAHIMITLTSPEAGRAKAVAETTEKTTKKSAAEAKKPAAARAKKAKAPSVKKEAAS